MDQRPDDFRPPRLTAEMASQRLLVLDFVRAYIGRWCQSPSQGEIANALEIDRTKVWRAIRSLERDGFLLRTPGPRGLALPGAEDEALRQLRAHGWIINPGERHVAKANMLPPAELDYAGPSAEGDWHGGTREG